MLEIKINVVNPAGWLIAALKANYLNLESYREKNNEKEKIIKTKEVEPESRIVKPEKIFPQKKEKDYPEKKS